MTLVPLAAWAGLAAPQGAAGTAELELANAEPVDFAREVRPLLSDRCFACHGPDEGRREADLRLDLREDTLRDRGGYAVVVPGDPDASELIRRIELHGRRGQMPPPSANLELSEAEVGLLRRWVAEGAVTEEHWSFTRPTRRKAPAVADEDWLRDPLDAFVLRRLEDVGLEPAPPADPATLLRRVYYDLTGLPPTVEELGSFLADPSEAAYESAVERLLASEAHAERMAADWLDAARYADTFGYQSDVDMHVWPWRDWVLEAFRDNLPYDRFLAEQLAGDLLPDATRSTRLATAFNRLHRQTNEGGSVEEEFRQSYIADRVETLGAAVMGLTLGCARCHDHKFDPISQRDFYGLASFFDDIDESGLYSHFTNAVPTPALDLPTDEQAAELARLEGEVRAAEAALDAAIEAAGSLPRAGAPAQGQFAFEPADPTANGIAGGAAAQLSDGPAEVPGWRGRGLQLSGENAVYAPGIGVFERSDPFSIALGIRLPQAFERAVVLHRTKSWTDSGSRGYQLLVEDGRLTVALVHFWPGDAIAIRTREAVATGRWIHVAFTYDGSSRADGLRLYLDGRALDTEVVRDRLTRTIRGGSIGHLALGSRFRDKGFVGGGVDELAVYDRQLAPGEVALLAEAGQLPAAPSDPAVDAAGERLRALRAERDALVDGIRQIMTMRTSPPLAAAQRTTFLLERGDYRSPAEPLEPALLAAFPNLGVERPRTRLDLARWLTHPDHPTTARVQVDRLWRVVFGRGLVRSPEDFGSQTPPPVHLELLDTLCRDFVESGWDNRDLLRRMVLSATYRQSTVTSTRSSELDPDGVLLSRSHSVPRSAEMVRDGALHAAGLLAAEFGGASVFPYQPPGLWQQKSGKTYPVGRGESLRRRSLYTFWKRTSPPPTLTTFGAPSREVCTVARPATVTPHQALALWNDPQFVEVAVTLARAAIEHSSQPTERIEFLCLALLSRAPDAPQAKLLLELWEQQSAAFAADPEAAVALASFDLERELRPSEAPEPPILPDEVAVEWATAAVVATTLLGLDEALTRR